MQIVVWYTLSKHMNINSNVSKLNWKVVSMDSILLNTSPRMIDLVIFALSSWLSGFSWFELKLVTSMADKGYFQNLSEFSCIFRCTEFESSKLHQTGAAREAPRRTNVLARPCAASPRPGGGFNQLRFQKKKKKKRHEQKHKKYEMMCDLTYQIYQLIDMFFLDSSLKIIQKSI